VVSAGAAGLAGALVSTGRPGSPAVQVLGVGSGLLGAAVIVYWADLSYLLSGRPGDNDRSADSRSFGLIDFGLIVGTVVRGKQLNHSGRRLPLRLLSPAANRLSGSAARAASRCSGCLPARIGRGTWLVFRWLQHGRQSFGRPVRIITLEPAAQLRRRPEHRAVGGVIQHLGRHADAGAGQPTYGFVRFPYSADSSSGSRLTRGRSVLVKSSPTNSSGSPVTEATA
jgi:hypothetical protein